MKLAVFSGTSEGRGLCRFLAAHAAKADVFVATEYGEAVMEPMAGIVVHRGRLTVSEMAAHMQGDTLVIDATHPYASAVTENIKAACAAVGAEYLRLLRPRTASGGVITVPDTAAAVAWLTAHAGKILLTTGSKELDAYTAIPDYRERLYPRVLPTTPVLQKCEALGFPGTHLIAMQGPFSHEMNVALLRQIGADILVTKDTGTSGGFAEKLSAARETGTIVLMVARPTEETGLSPAQMQAYLKTRLNLTESTASVPRFPLFVSLLGKRALVVGAGAIAARRIRVLVRFGAEVTVVAPEKRAEFDADYFERPFEPRDLDGVSLAIAATDDRAVNQQVGALCTARGIPVSVADCAAESTFFFPAVCEGGGLVAGLVSDGTAHHKVSHVARQIRTLLEENE